MSATPASRPSAAKPADMGPVGMLFAVSIGLVVTTILSWGLSIVVEFAGMHVEAMWKDRGILHSRDMVIEDLGYIQDAPHSLIVADTVGFSQSLMGQVARPFQRLDVMGFYRRTGEAAAWAERAPVEATRRAAVGSALKRSSAGLKHTLATVAVIAYYTAQDTALRLAIVVFALPAFVLACLVGAVDGLVRRDLRKWGGGRESSFVYHHAKATTTLVLGGGFSLYLAWPTGGFNPAYMVLVFTVLVAWSLSLTLSSFKKYL